MKMYSGESSAALLLVFSSLSWFSLRLYRTVIKVLPFFESLRAALSLCKRVLEEESAVHFSRTAEEKSQTIFSARCRHHDKHQGSGYGGVQGGGGGGRTPDERMGTIRGTGRTPPPPSLRRSDLFPLLSFCFAVATCLHPRDATRVGLNDEGAPGWQWRPRDALPSVQTKTRLRGGRAQHRRLSPTVLVALPAYRRDMREGQRPLLRPLYVPVMWLCVDPRICSKKRQKFPHLYELSAKAGVGNYSLQRATWQTWILSAGHGNFVESGGWNRANVPAYFRWCATQMCRPGCG